MSQIPFYLIRMVKNELQHSISEVFMITNKNYVKFRKICITTILLNSNTVKYG